MSAIDISVIISTYNHPEWLQKVIWSYENQSLNNFELVIADDGSDDDTKKLIETLKKEVSFSIQHIWHEDRGFQKTRILNKAITACIGDYLVFSDGDCVARCDYLQAHVNNRQKGYFLSGGYFKLPLIVSQKISKQDILSGDCFKLNWLKKNGLKGSFKNNKLTSKGFKSKILNAITPTNPSWNGHNASGWKADILMVNGFDERMQYGGEDRELGERLLNFGIKPKQIRYSAICLHLDHERGYVKPEMIEKNIAIRTITKKEKVTRTAFGIEK